MIKKWRKISSKQVFSHPRHSVFIDTVRLPNNQLTEYVHFGEPHVAAMIIAQRADGKILLQKEYSYPPDEVLFQFPGGLVNLGESIEAGALRELAEEAQLKGVLKALGWMYLDNRRTASKMHFFLATNLSKSSGTKDIEEEFENYWLDETEIEELITSNEIKNYTALSGWAFYKAHTG